LGSVGTDFCVDDDTGDKGVSGIDVYSDDDVATTADASTASTSRTVSSATGDSMFMVVI
jgi:hypothetical protein